MRMLSIFVSVAALAAFGTAQAFAATVVVDDDGKGEVGDCGSSTAASTTIQDGIDAAGPGDTVFVCRGTYVEDLSITKDDLELKGTSCKRTKIVGIAKLPAASFPLADPNIDIRANGVSISDFTIRHPVVAGDEYSSGIVVGGKNNSIHDNCFEVGAGDISQGIQTYRDAAGVLSSIDGLNISLNKFKHLSPLPTGSHSGGCSSEACGYEGIFINHQTDAVDPQNPVIIGYNSFKGEVARAITTERDHTLILDNEIRTRHGSEFGGAFPRGIQIQNHVGGDNVNNVVVANNNIKTKKDGFFGTGLLVRSGSTGNVLLYGNSVKGAETGIQVGTSAQGEAKGNTLIDNVAKKSGTLDCEDLTTGTGTAGTANNWIHNIGKLDAPDGICNDDDDD